MTLRPRQLVPALEVEIIGGATWRLHDSKPKSFSLIVAYRGLHCRMCKPYICEIEAKLPEFARRGVDVTALSSDSLARAEKTWADWGLKEIRLGYELSFAAA